MYHSFFYCTSASTSINLNLTIVNLGRKLLLDSETFSNLLYETNQSTELVLLMHLYGHKIRKSTERPVFLLIL